MFNKGFGVVAHTRYGDVLRAFSSEITDVEAQVQRSIDISPLRIAPVEVRFASNGNVQQWNLLS